MTVSIEFLISIGLFILAVAGFFIKQTRDKSKEDVEKGRMLQKIETLEKDLSKIGAKVGHFEERISCHDSELVKVDGKIDMVMELVKSMDKKLDQMISNDFPKDYR